MDAIGERRHRVDRRVCPESESWKHPQDSDGSTRRTVNRHGHEKQLKFAITFSRPVIEAAAIRTPAGLSKAGLSGVERRTMKRSMKRYGLVSVSFHGPAGLSRAGLSGVERRRRRLGDGSTRPPLCDLSGVKSVHQTYIDSVHWHIIYEY